MGKSLPLSYTYSNNTFFDGSVCNISKGLLLASSASLSGKLFSMFEDAC